MASFSWSMLYPPVILTTPVGDKFAEHGCVGQNISNDGKIQGEVWKYDYINSTGWFHNVYCRTSVLDFAQ